MSIDFNYYPLVIDKSRKGIQTPGMLVSAAPRSANRHRREDLLAVFLRISGEHRYQAEEISALVQEAAHQFFQMQGSVTKAMQTICELVNKQMLASNIDQAYEGIQAKGSITLAVLHEQWLFIGQFGDSTAYKISAERFNTFGASEGQPESLGQMKHVQLRFYHCDISPGDLIILGGQPVDSWSASNLSGSASLSASALQRRLLSQAPAELEAMVIRCVQGSGQAIAGSWTENISSAGIKKTDDDTSQPAFSPGLLDTIPANEEEKIQNENIPQLSSHGEPETDLPLVEADEPAADGLAPEEDEIPVLAGETEQQLSSARASSSANPALLKLARTWMNAKTLMSKIRLFNSKIRQRIFRNQQASLTGTVPLITLLIALAVPVGLVIASVSVYTRTGKEEQYSAYFNQAQEVYELAENVADAQKKHAYWAQTVELVSRAEEFKVTRDSRLLFEQAQFLMDEMDLAARLEFRPALTSFLPQGTVISRIRSSYSGMYLLDKTSGSVLRLFLNVKGFYDVDDAFKCAPRPYGEVIVTKLVDFITLPANDDNYKVMAIDAQGNMLYCRSDDPPISKTLTPPEGGWGRIAALGYDQDVLYILDAENSAIWMYAGKNPNKMEVPGATGVFFVESPIQFLDEDIPDLQGGVDMAINQHELFVMHEDGHMTLCRYNPIKEVRLTECQDPAPYTDNRIGRENKKPWIFMDASFMMMQDIKVPTLSIFILDIQEPSVFQFSFQLNLEQTLRIMQNKNYPLPGSPPSGFGVTPDMEIILAFDNRLYLAPTR